MSGKFITFEGGEGSGKSTQVKRLAEALRKKGLSIVETREPGGSPGAEMLRHVLLSGVAEALGPKAEALLFAAARDDHLRVTIRPALARGDWVICDRFADSTRVYQGLGGKVDTEFLDQLEELILQGLKPDLTIILDIPAELGMERAARRRNAEGGGEPDRFEKHSVAHHEQLRKGFLDIAKKEPERCAVVDATASENDIEAAIWTIVTERLEP
ncbi:MAG: dTMP kinase [Hyphomicrobiales bacterium]|nr:dTMP kinase [Hyphomicrobiales bacterium]